MKAECGMRAHWGAADHIYLDDLSTWMDPVARQDLWRVISNMVTGVDQNRNPRTCVILTTHSMEECKELCPQIAIMELIDVLRLSFVAQRRALFAHVACLYVQQTRSALEITFWKRILSSKYLRSMTTTTSQRWANSLPALETPLWSTAPANSTMTKTATRLPKTR